MGKNAGTVFFNLQPGVFNSKGTVDCSYHTKAPTGQISAPTFNLRSGALDFKGSIGPYYCLYHTKVPTGQIPAPVFNLRPGAFDFQDSMGHQHYCSYHYHVPKFHSLELAAETRVLQEENAGYD